jgi:hypothetical protein
MVMLSDKRASFILISFFIITLLFGVYSRSESEVFAAKSVPGYTCGHPTGLPAGKTRCCGIDLRDTKIYCTDCDDTQPPSNCSPRFRSVGETAPPSNLAPPSTSQTTTCPDGSSPDANGVCPPPTTTGNQNPQSLNNNNNIQSQEQNNKRSNLLGHAGELTGKKKGSSHTPPPCPTDNSPIPPNCTLKPKF